MLLKRTLGRIGLVQPNLIRRWCTVEAQKSQPPPPHIPVLCDVAIEYLDPEPEQTFLDMTFGAGGHTRRLLDRCDSIRVYALDRDPVAYGMAQALSKEYEEGRVVPLLGKFSDLPKLLEAHDVPMPNTFDGVLFDFGCSSMQFDRAERGFSLIKNGPLDMRMDGGLDDSIPSAADVVANADEADLARILHIYGEEKNYKKIARGIVEARSMYGRITTTQQLADLIVNYMAGTYRMDKLRRHAHVATKTFQALRIFVNNELNEINHGMLLANDLLRPLGRLVTITFHSLEDRIVKRHLNGNIVEGLANPLPLKYSSYDAMIDADQVRSLVDTPWQQLHKHVILPTEAEVNANSRSRSAKLRAAVKIK